MKEEVISFSNIYLRLSDRDLLKYVNINILKNEILSFIGPHGTGKTLFSQIISGFRPPTEGQISINGNIISDYTEIKAKQLGIFYLGKVFQLINNLSIEENLNVLTDSKRFYYNRKKSEIEAVKILQKYSVNINPKRKIAEMNFYDRVIFQLIKFLESGAKIIIIDEIANLLSSDEIKRLIHFIKTLKKTDRIITFIYITNRLDDFVNNSTDIYFWKRGMILNHQSGSEFQKKRNNHWYFHENQLLNQLHRNTASKSNFFSICNFHIRKKKLDLNINSRDIVGILDIDNSAVDFFDQITSEKLNMDIYLENTKLRTYQGLLSKGIQVITRNYDWNEYFSAFSEVENLSLNTVKKLFNKRLINKRIQSNLFQEVFKDDDLSEKNWIRKKIIIERKLLQRPKLLIIDNIFGSFASDKVRDFQNLLINEINRGLTIILFFSDFSEVTNVCNKLYIPDYTRNQYLEIENLQDEQWENVMELLP